MTADNGGPLSGWRSDLADELMWDRRESRTVEELWSASSRRGMVATAHYRATRAGAEILEAGGNAVDAAVAASLALAVTESAGSGLGGMAMMTIHTAGDGRTFFLPGPCRAPRRATPEAVAASDRYSGYRAVAVPTYVSLMDHALRTYGTMSAEAVLSPAMALASDGFPLTPLQIELIRGYSKGLSRAGAAASFLEAGIAGADIGRMFRQPALASTLGTMARSGFRDFYEGEIASEIDRDMRENDGFVRADDLAAVPPPEETEPLRAGFRGDEVLCPGSPAGGRTLLEMLNLLTELAPDGADVDTPRGMEIMAAIIRRARADWKKYRLELPEDPDLAGASHARRAARELREEIGKGETSHVSAADADGNAVAVTQSIERSFGAKVATPGLGFLYNGYMKAFKIQAKKHPHFLRPGAVARSNAAPTIVLRAGKLRAAVGNTGSERMLSGIFGVLARLDRASPFEAVHAPRLHVTPERVALVEDRFPPGCIEALERRGYTIERTEPYAFRFGGLQLVIREGDLLIGVGEPRRDGAAAGP